MNKITERPRIHICIFDRLCWHDMWNFGMPMRVQYKDKLWTIPVLIWISNWRSRKMWDWENPVRINPRDFQTKTENEGDGGG